MAYQIGGVTGNVIKGVTEATGSYYMSGIFKPITGTTATEIYARTWDLTDIDYIDMHTKVTDPVGNTTLYLKFDGTAEETIVGHSGDELSTDIDVTAYSGEVRVSIEIKNDNGAGVSTLTELDFNVRVG